MPSHTPPLAEDDAANSFGPFASKTDGSDARVMHDYEAVEMPKRCSPSADFLAGGAGLVRLRSFLKEGLSGLKHCKVQRSGGVFHFLKPFLGYPNVFPKILT